ncbi:unnamed protein product [Arabidopsis thaliana]|uniref:Uncharacterized protein n=3 Tax=Arabidopsis TaxID=3701 RepID=A0A654EPK2_ARATH|nr:uncharacterized protein AT1G29355 [Arabidopsis thaliana]AEE31076.1 hypothetical protein AT1G29355 [Arabidopsis thaliana]VYS47491.1 unnamed protein product [Arabidopsis thaliana]|eukprot:NP_683332.1 hypothetical protein AT1G29355 [Arabidopsis thaliana]
MIYNEQESCPLNLVAQKETLPFEKDNDKSLGKLTSGKKLTLSTPTATLQLSTNGRIHPSWWRPDLVKPTQAKEDPTTSDYRRRKTEGKQVVNANSKHAWRRIDNSRSQNWNPPANARYSNHHTTRDDSQGYDRRIEWSTASIPRTREKLMRPSEIKNPSSVREIPPFKDSGRKRRYDDTLENHNHKPSSSKERAVTRRMNQNKSPAAASKSAGLSHVSDSQLTVSDPLISSLRLDKEKSWYDQTVEEEENHAQEAPLEARFSNAIHIGELPSANPENTEINASEMEIKSEETWEEEEEFMQEDVNDT